MNIGIDLRALTHGTTSGVTVYLKNVLEQLPQVDKQNQYFLWWNARPDSAAEPPVFRSPRFKVIVTHHSNTKLHMKMRLGGLELDRLILTHARRGHEKMDALWVPDPRPVRVSENCRLITTVHDRSPEVNPSWFNLRTRLWHQLLNQRKIAEQSDTVLTPSAATTDDIVKHWQLDPARVQPTPLGAPAPARVTPQQIARVRKKYHLPKNYILTLGTLEPRKNLATAVTAVARLKQETTLPHELVVAGRTDRSIFASMRLGRANWLHTPGFIAETDKPALYAGAAAFLAPSFLEGFDLPVVEALAAGTPAIASDIPVHHEVAGIHTAFVDPHNTDAWYLKLKTVLQTKDDPAQKKARQDHATKYSWRKTAEATVAALTSRGPRTPVRRQK